MDANSIAAKEPTECKLKLHHCGATPAQPAGKNLGLARKPLSRGLDERWHGWLMQDSEQTIVLGPIMVVKHTGKVGRVFGKIYAYEIILRLRFSDGYEANFRLTSLHTASTAEIKQFEREELLYRKFPSPPPPRLSA